MKGEGAACVASRPSQAAASISETERWMRTMGSVKVVSSTPAGPERFGHVDAAQHQGERYRVVDRQGLAQDHDGQQRPEDRNKVEKNTGPCRSDQSHRVDEGDLRDE